MRIGELSQRTAVSVRSLRYYEEKGMLAADRNARGQRIYTANAVDRVIRIQELFAAGLSSDQVAGLLPCMRDCDGGPSARATPFLIDALVGQRQHINRTIKDLVRSREVLDDVITAAADGRASLADLIESADRDAESRR